MQYKAYRIKAVLFDFDGTLTKPGALNFPLIKQNIGCPIETPILEFIAGLPTSSQQAEAQAVLERFESDAAEISEPNTGAEDLIHYLRSKRLGLGIFSRNRLDSIKRALQNFKTVHLSDFDVIITRDTAVNPKPSPDGVLLAAQKLKTNPNHILVVGDFLFDIQAGQLAGSLTAWLDNGLRTAPYKTESDFSISLLEELKDIVRLGLPLPAGKLPNAILQKFLDRFEIHDPSILIKAAVGEDAAAINAGDTEVLVLKSDPITFVTDSIGHYAVLINANDIATSGAKPRWMLTTLLFPCGTSASEIGQVMYQLESMCRKCHITLCGGHTEITDAVTRPVITGMLAGTVAKSDLIEKRNMRPADRVLLTKAVAVEGTSIIAREFEERLLNLGMPAAEIEKGKMFLSDLGILREAAIAASCDGVSAMHDVTEGGLATALEELSIAGGHKIRIDMETIPYLPQTIEISRLLKLNPLGLIGSGSLLICCRKDATTALIRRIQEAGIQITCIGEVLEAGQGIEATQNNRPAQWPDFEVDELTRLFE